MNETILENVFSRRQQRRRNSLTCVQILTQKQFSNRTTTQSLIRKRIRVNQLRRKMHYEMNQQEEEQDHSMMTPQPLSNQPQQQLSPVGSLIASANQMSNVIPSHSQPPTLTISDQQQQPLHLSQIKQVVSQFFESLLQSKETLEGKKSLPMTAQEKEKIAQEIISTPF
ncbi:hypothetical protein C9374_008803 [Naegleria lovaniensis]|uniref:Uncharacterized protein n=1 Tax=Naegleria lovaniensis TaxID=51637 RepID=A0AA88GFR6_NAELO|nr:uncharacterized protein C9374_008803 [Naegleria lovaniensis]KAG2377718.1 hypothetical protein C9374_008803 [Naegleria lovaniensis]